MNTSSERFVVIPDALTNDVKMIILADYRFWAEHENELRHWCQETDSEFVGMTVTVPNLPTLTAFVLKWS